MKNYAPAVAGFLGLPGREPSKGDRWVLFDGDNTLWHIEPLYDCARQDLVKYITQYGVDSQEIEVFQRLEDKRLFREIGYSATRFATSFENTLRKFVPEAVTAEVQHARHMALSVFERPAEVDPDATRVLDSLKSSHNLALITAGEVWVQERRLADFRHTDMFDCIRIVERKTAALFRELVADLAIAPEVSWVVGDSLRSDIMPALDAGLNAILTANHNWMEVERDELGPIHLNVVDRLSDILPIIVASGPGTPAPVNS